MPLHPVIAGLMVIAALGLIIGVAWLLHRSQRFHPEFPRKLVHVGMGLVCIPLPWLFTDPLPVQILAGLAFLALAALRLVPALRRSLGSTLHDVSRSSIGDLLFPLAIAILFTLSHHDPVLYLVPLLLLTIADAAGALAGIRYGKTRFGTSEGFKSVEGSLSFLFLAFLCAHLPLLLATDTGRLEAVLIAAILALLTTMAEAISTRGLDNFIIPVAGLLLLKIFLAMPVQTLAVRLVVLLLLLLLVLAAHRWTTLRGSALLAAAFLGYGCFALGDWRFVLPPMGLFLIHLLTTYRLKIARELVHGVDAIGSLAVSSLPWPLATAAGLLEAQTALFPFAASFAAHLAMIHCDTQRWAGAAKPGIFLGSAKGILICLGPVTAVVLFQSDPDPSVLLPISVHALLAPIIPIFIVASAFIILRRRRGGEESPMWSTEALLAFAASLAVLALSPFPLDQ